MDLTEATILYEFARRADVMPYLVTHLGVKEFALNLRTFERRLGEVSQESYWREKLRALKRYRFRLCSVPLPCNEPSEAEQFEQLARKLHRCDQIYPQFAEQACSLVEQAQMLSRLPDNPLLNQIFELELPANSAILIKESRFIDLLETLLSKILQVRHLRVVTAPQLRGETLFDHLAIIGPMRWFPDYVVTAPRAECLHLIRYRFSGDGWKPRITFMRKENTPTPRLLVSTPPVEPEVEMLDATELLPAIDWNAVSTRLSASGHLEEGREFVEARLCVLENDHAVFLEASGSELVIDLASKEILRRVKVNKLEPDMFLIVREKGGGDYIVPLADRILGELAVPARQAQRHWKEALRKAVLIRGMSNVLKGLRQAGARTASEQNVRGWMSASERKIRPRHYEDFRAVMHYLCLAEDVDVYWKTARNINRAHHMAGMRMKKLLLAEVKKSDLKRLEQHGYQSFALPGYEASIKAFRIVEVIKSTASVPLAQIGELLEV